MASSRIAILFLFSALFTAAVDTPSYAITQDQSDLHETLLGRNFFKLERYLGDITETDDDAASHLAHAYVAVLRYDFDRAKTLLDGAAAKVAETNDERLKSLLVTLNYLYLDATEQHLAYAEYIKANSSRPQEAFLEELDRRAKRGAAIVHLPEQPVVLENVGRGTSWLLIKGQINGKDASLLLDTGGQESLFSSDSVQKYKLPPVGSAQVSEPQANTFNFAFTQIEELRFNSARLSNIPVSIGLSSTLNEQLTYLRDGIFGFKDIVRLQGLELKVVDGEVASVSFFRPTLQPESTKESTLFVYHYKPIVPLEIGDDIYSCLIDTGAHVSFVSEDIFKKFKKSLKLKAGKKSGKTTFLGSENGQRYKTIKRLPAKIAGTDVHLQNVLRRENSGEDYCFLGLDAVKAAEGMTLDFVNMRATFGSSKETVK